MLYTVQSLLKLGLNLKVKELGMKYQWFDSFLIVQLAMYKSADDVILVLDT